MEFVVNEWLPEYFKPSANIEEKRKLEKFLNRFLERNDMLCVRQPSEFLSKIYRYSKEFQNYRVSASEIKKFIRVVLSDSERCRFVRDDEFQLPASIKSILVEGGNTVSDTYLFKRLPRRKQNSF